MMVGLPNWYRVFRFGLFVASWAFASSSGYVLRVKGSAYSWWDPLVVPYGCQHQPALPTTPTSFSRGACYIAICGLCPCSSHYGPQSMSGLSLSLYCCNIAMSTFIMDPGDCHRWAHILLVGSRHHLSLDGVSSCDIRVSCFSKPCKFP